MEYFKILNLNKEPFSNSPDPEYFFQSRQHLECLQKLELSLRLRRGLNVVIGAVGTGKTTLCRQLIRKFLPDDDIETHLILDPNFSSPSEFLVSAAEMFIGTKPGENMNDWQVKETIKQYLFRKGVDESKTVVLIIDEGQKIPVFCLEILRELLNFETNEYKLLQIAIFAQNEFEKTLSQHANFADRINLKHQLKPMNFKDTRSMIQYRLRQSSGSSENPVMITSPAFWAIYRETGGYPRKIINLCHRCILTMLVQNSRRIGWFLVRSCIKRDLPTAWRKRWQIAAAAFIGFALATIVAANLPEGVKIPGLNRADDIRSASFKIEKTSFIEEATLEQTKPSGIKRTDPSALSNATDAASPKSEIPSSTEPGSKVGIQNVFMNSSGTSPASEKSLPEMIGKVTLVRNETLWRLVKKVFGICTTHHLNALIGLNPEITDPDHVEVGQVISVPTVPFPIKRIPENSWWIEVAKRDNLESAIQFLRTYPNDAPKIRLLPYWSNREGLRFAVLLGGHFSNEATAEARLKEIPSHLAPKGKIISSWDEDTVFFSNPFIG